MVAVMDRVGDDMVGAEWRHHQLRAVPLASLRSHPPRRLLQVAGVLQYPQDADLPEDTPVLRVPKDKARYAEASQIQQEIAQLTRYVVDSGRQLEEQAQWTPLPITAAVGQRGTRSAVAGSSSWSRNWRSCERREDIREEEKAERKDLAQGIAETRRDGPRQGSEQAGSAFRSTMERCRLRPERSGQSVYELTATVDAPVMTAIRIEVSPANAETARHTPEDGFIVDQIEAWVIQPDGQQEKIAFRYFVPDSEDESGSCVVAATRRSREQKPTADSERAASAANPKLFRARWIVGVPASPLRVAARQPAQS